MAVRVLWLTGLAPKGEEFHLHTKRERNGIGCVGAGAEGPPVPGGSCRDRQRRPGAEPVPVEAEDGETEANHGACKESREAS